MERSLGLLLLVLGALAIIDIVQAQSPSQQGFISLDCGLAANEPSPYTDAGTELQFSSDATYIKSGNTSRVATNLEGRLMKPYATVRYFPEGIRNCYNLPVEKGRKHLVRAWFIYGNYDGRDINPKFDLYLGPNPWATIDLEKLVNGTREEIFHIPTSNSLQICLVKTGTTTPMISALEIRPLGNNSYITKSGSLSLYFRVYLTQSEKYIRYKNDVYDRQWLAYFQDEWTQISTTSDVGNSNFFDPPKAALATAAIPTNASEPLTIKWNNSEKPDDQYYLYRHFAEIQDLRANETREFNMVWNEEVMTTEPVIPDKFEITTMLSLSPRTCARGECKFQLIRTNRSTLPPLLNAFEVFTVIQFPQSETNETEVAAMRNIESTYVLSRINWQGDPCFPQQLRWDALNCSNSDISTPPRITSLNLSSIGLTGTIAAAIQNLTELEKLDLSNNNLTGEVPEFLGNIKTLLFINLSGNDLNGSIPQALERKGVELLLHGNPRLCHLTDSCTKPHSKKFPVAIVASVACMAILVAVLVLFLVFRKKKLSTLEAQQLPPMANVTSADSHEPLVEMKSRRFTYSEIIRMTNNFQRILGKGGFGMVYHGTTVNGSQEVAVKVLSQSSTQGYKEFRAEVDLLLRVHHTNLVSLVGYCYEGDHLGLVYEFLPNGDLKQHLSGKGGKSIINWGIRLRIALEAALGLEYLHIGCTPPMVHRDVKTANILLDENLKAKLADFGLSRSFQVGGETNDSTVIAGTHGYLDPEYYNSGRLGEKSDVFSFGIVLLEIITNQRVISENSHITQSVGSKLNRGDINGIMDPNLGGVYDTNSAWRALELAMSCADPHSANRPTMSHVIIELKECLACENSRISESRGFESQEMSVDTSVVPGPR
uniref:non-specific serine/threonine protein kinase n=2 Tax=Noccaea caerulescens TaxID=107243 RepID=A0A1J3FSR6_NOCCA